MARSQSSSLNEFKCLRKLSWGRGENWTPKPGGSVRRLTRAPLQASPGTAAPSSGYVVGPASPASGLRGHQAALGWGHRVLQAALALRPADWGKRMHTACAHMSTSPRMPGTEGSLLAAPLLGASFVGYRPQGSRVPEKGPLRDPSNPPAEEQHGAGSCGRAGS